MFKSNKPKQEKDNSIEYCDFIYQILLLLTPDQFDRTVLKAKETRDLHAKLKREEKEKEIRQEKATNGIIRFIIFIIIATLIAIFFFK
jgi:hypothetical protein